MPGAPDKKVDKMDVESDSDDELSDIPDGEFTAGTIKKITLKNFMSHENFEIKLTPRVNFITGRNGTGKSAILAGIMVCFGARASVTERGKSLRHLVRHGQNYGSVAVTLSNEGDNAYHPEDYGKTITIERSFTITGGSSYRVKDEKNKTKKESGLDVQTILEHFDISVNNPVTLMSQDATKKFLTGTSSADKYKSFLQATSVDSLKNELGTIQNRVREMERALKSKETTLPLQVSQVEDLRQQFEQFDQVRKLKEQLKIVSGKLAWAYVAEAEEAAADAEEAIQLMQNSKLIPQQEKTAALAQDLEQKKKAVEEALEIAADLQKAMNSADGQTVDNRRYVELQKKIGNKTSDRKALEMNMSVARQTILDLQNGLNDALKEGSKGDEALTNKISKIISLLQKNDVQIAHLSDTIPELRNERETVQKDHYQLQQTSRAAMKEVRQLESKVAAMKNNQKNKAVIFGAEMPKIIKVINDNKAKFKEAPVGPFGLYVDLKEEAWGPAVEAAIGFESSTFVVSCRDDRDLLVKILKSARVSQIPKVMSNKWQKQQYPAKNLAQFPNLTRVIDVVTIRHPMVSNCLIDAKKIDAVILAKDRPTAERVVRQEKRATKCILPNRITYVSRGNATTSITPSGRARSWLGRDIKSQVLELEADLAAARATADELTAQFNGASEQLRRVKGDLAKQERALANAQEQSSKLTMQRDELREGTNEDTNRTGALEDQLATLKDDLELNQTRLDKIKEELKVMHGQRDALKAQREAQQAQESEALERVNQQSEEATRLDELRSIAEDKYNSAQARMATIQNHIVRATADLEDKKTTLAQRTEQAKEIEPERPDLGRKDQPKKLATKAEALDDRIQREKKKRKKDPEVVEAKYKRAKRDLMKTKSRMDRTGINIAQLHTCLKSRLVKAKGILKTIQSRTSADFKYFLSQKGHTGQLKMDHKGRTMHIMVGIDSDSSTSKSSARKREIRAIETLSGGERSYSTVALLLSLWEHSEQPFLAVDEFDVYMDATHRKLSLDLLVAATRATVRNTRRQFIFVTPHDLSDLNLAENPQVTIQKLAQARAT